MRPSCFTLSFFHIVNDQSWSEPSYDQTKTHNFKFTELTKMKHLSMIAKATHQEAFGLHIWSAFGKGK